MSYFYGHEYLKRIVATILRNYGFDVNFECWVGTPGITLQRVDVCGKCTEGGICDDHTIGVEVELTSNLQKDLRSLSTGRYTIKIVYAPAYYPSGIQTVSGENSTTYVVHTLDELNSLLCELLRPKSCPGIPKITPNDSLLKYLESNRSTAPTPLEAFESKINSFGLANYRNEVLKTLLWGYYQGELPISMGHYRDFYSTDIVSTWYIDEKVSDILKQLEYAHIEARGTYSNGRLHYGVLTPEGETLCSVVERNELDKHINGILNTVSSDPITSFAAFSYLCFSGGGFDSRARISFNFPSEPIPIIKSSPKEYGSLPAEISIYADTMAACLRISENYEHSDADKSKFPAIHKLYEFLMSKFASYDYLFIHKDDIMAVSPAVCRNVLEETYNQLPQVLKECLKKIRTINKLPEYSEKDYINIVTGLITEGISSDQFERIVDELVNIGALSGLNKKPGEHAFVIIDHEKPNNVLEAYKNKVLHSVLYGNLPNQCRVNL